MGTKEGKSNPIPHSSASLPVLLQISTERPVETIWPHDENAKRAFSMYNSYADSLDTLQQHNASMYAQIGQNVAEREYPKLSGSCASAIVQSATQIRL